MIYLIGSLRNKKIPKIGTKLRKAGFDVFDDWWGAGERADDAWKEYESIRGRSYREALKGDAAETIFNFDLDHLKRASAGVLVYPAGKSGHIEFGWVCRNVPGYILLPGEPKKDRWDLMLKFATYSGGDIVYSVEELVEKIGERSLAR